MDPLLKKIISYAFRLYRTGSMSTPEIVNRIEQMDDERKAKTRKDLDNLDHEPLFKRRGDNE